jgi:hypothetical protein
VSRETLQICAWLGIPHVDGGLRNRKWIEQQLRAAHTP